MVSELMIVLVSMLVLIHLPTQLAPQASPLRKASNRMLPFLPGRLRNPDADVSETALPRRRKVRKNDRQTTETQSARETDGGGGSRRSGETARLPNLHRRPRTATNVAARDKSTPAELSSARLGSAELKASLPRAALRTARVQWDAVSPFVRSCDSQLLLRTPARSRLFPSLFRTGCCRTFFFAIGRPSGDRVLFGSRYVPPKRIHRSALHPANAAVYMPCARLSHPASRRCAANRCALSALVPPCTAPPLPVCAPQSFAWL